MLWEMYQYRAINNASSKASHAEVKVTTVGRNVRRLEDKLDSLALTCQALWEILRDRTKLTEEDLIEKIMEIDLRDGKEDGRMGTAGAPCPRCNRVLSRRHDNCMYCGEEVGKSHLFQQ
jgi:hypothetical protein